MTVYVDTMRAPLGRMTMCHMIADTTDELLAMRRYLGLEHVPLQDPGTYREHLDICLSKRRMAVAVGAKEITQRKLGEMLRARRSVVPEHP
jgi:hypothetical protein